MEYKGLPLDPFQEEAIRVLDREESLFVAAPTGAGKTLIAEYAIERCLQRGGRLLYTAPIKALSNQKFRDFTAEYGDRIGIKTGDVTINPDAQVLLMTTEIFRNTIFESPESFRDVRYVVFDEIHYLDDIERGTVWEESLIFAPPHLRLLCLSATVPNLEALARWIRSIRGSVKLHVIVEERRPVPLRHQIFVPGLGLTSLEDLHRMERDDLRRHAVRIDPHLNPHRWRAGLIDHLAESRRLPALWFAFNRRECEEFAALVHRPLLTPAERERILRLYGELLARFDLAPGPTTDHLGRLLGKGVAYHHAGLLPTLKEIVERIFTTGLLKLLFATETFAVGVNMPARTVVFNSLLKFDGRRMGPIKAREHRQMSGRAGRRGIDEVGFVYTVVEWPHVRAAEAERVLKGPVEPIRSQFNLSYATLLTLWDRLGERIYAAAEKSFANFSESRGGGAAFRGKREQMKRKFAVLRTLGYLRDGRLTPKGRFAAALQGYELPVAELLFRGVLRTLSEEELCILFHALVYESKKGDWARRFETPRLRALRRATLAAFEAIRRAEEAADVADPTKPPDFKLAGAVDAWARGADWEDLDAHTGASDGDLVRFFRLALQLLRNTFYALPPEDPLRARLRGAADRLNRGVVDAERQLRLGTRIPDGPEAPPAP